MKAYNAVADREPETCRFISRNKASKMERKSAITWESDATRTEALVKMCRKFSKKDVTTVSTYIPTN